jgi:predicted AAA+ superfamily ATPase
MLFNRIINLPNLLKKKSFFLFGPRATWKSFLIKQQFSPAIPVINLLKSEMYFRLSSKPQELESMIKAYPDLQIVIIDEVQRVPMLLNEVHRLIEEQHLRFLLTGSSARKLYHQHTNLLAGRAWEASLFPLTSAEIPQFDLKRYLHFGGLPPVYLSDDPREELIAYVHTYLQQEIQIEALVRRIPAFTRFLTTAALTSGETLNFTSIGSDVGLSPSTIREYYQVLQDTFIGFLVTAWTKTIKRKAISTAKFYFFDIGVKNTLANIKHLEPASDLYGQAFEHFIALELRAYLSYRRLHLSLCYWRSVHGHEVDFIIGDEIAIEVKTTQQVNDKHLKGLNILAEENICKKYYLISFDSIQRRQNNIEIMPWQIFLEQLWDDKIIS